MSKQLCVMCQKPLGVRSYQAETGHWVATGMFPTMEFCGFECGNKWLRTHGHNRSAGGVDECADNTDREHPRL